ncbi:MAG: hypothetical protein EB105_04645 [Actinobacteria bacterium]|nr:hypothetical protein [Actinomycetota bacterium]
MTFEADSLAALDQVTKNSNVETNWLLYVVLIVTALLFGCAEVLRDNSAQTLLPSVVEEKQLESANGKLWSVEFLANSFIGPPLGSFILGIAIYLPFYFDASTFFISAALILTIVPAFKSSAPANTSGKIKFGAEIREGFGWLWRHELLRPMAIILGLMNLLGAMSTAVFILFAQEVLQTSVFVFAVLGTAGAYWAVLIACIASLVGGVSQ